MRNSFGYDLPPGVRTNDIPGCRPQDEEHEVVITLTQEELNDITQFGVYAHAMASVAYQIQGRRVIHHALPHASRWRRMLLWLTK